jgi:putative oxidoreductase
MMVAGVLELVGGALIMVGLFTRPVAFVLAGEMAVAYFMSHVPNGGILPIANRGEAAALFCFIFLFLAGNGPSIWSLDHARARGRIDGLDRPVRTRRAPVSG